MILEHKKWMKGLRKEFKESDESKDNSRQKAKNCGLCGSNTRPSDNRWLKLELQSDALPAELRPLDESGLSTLDYKPRATALNTTTWGDDESMVIDRVDA